MKRKNIILLWLSLFFYGVLSVYGATIVDQLPFIKTKDYKLNLAIDYENEILSADCTMTVLNTSQSPLKQIPLILYRLLKVEAVTDEKGDQLMFSQNVTQFEDWGQMQINYIAVSLDKPLLKGEKKTIKINYKGYLLGYTETGMSYVKDRIDKKFTIIRRDCKAYPVVGYPSWKANKTRGLQAFDYLINVTVPDTLKVANGGELKGKSAKNGQVTYSYKNIKPAWRMDIAAADYHILTDKTGNLKIFCFPQHKEGARDILDVMAKTMKLYADWFGPLKGFNHFSVIELPSGYGSQADVTSILQVEEAFGSKEEHYQFYHELSHLWNLKPLDPIPCRFESEGLAMFLQYLVKEKLENKTDAVEKAFERMRERYLKQCQKKPGYLDIPMIDFGNKGITDLSYSKGMIFFNLLYELVGEKKFFNIIKSFYQKYEGKGAATDDFANHLNNYSKKDLSQFTRDWIYGTQSSRDLMDKLSLKEMAKKY